MKTRWGSSYKRIPWYYQPSTKGIPINSCFERGALKILHIVTVYFLQLRWSHNITTSKMYQKYAMYIHKSSITFLVMYTYTRVQLCAYLWKTWWYNGNLESNRYVTMVVSFLEKHLRLLRGVIGWRDRGCVDDYNRSSRLNSCTIVSHNRLFAYILGITESKVQIKMKQTQRWPKTYTYIDCWIKSITKQHRPDYISHFLSSIL